MTTNDNNTKTIRLDEKRKFLLPLILILISVAFIVSGALRQFNVKGKSLNEYQFNNAVITNDLSERDIETTDKTTKPSKTKKKEPAFCAT